MKKPWVTLFAVIVVGLAAGAAIAGRPTTPAHDVRIVDVPTTSETSTTAASTQVTSARPVTATTAAAPTATTTASTGPATTIPPSTTPTTGDSFVATADTGSAPPPLPDRNVVRVVVANASKRSNLAGAEATRLLDLGYAAIGTGDAQPLDRTVVYARPGYEGEALRLLADVNLPNDRLQPYPTVAVTAHDDKGDVIFVLGLDWQP